MAKNNVVEFTLRAKDAATSVVRRIGGSIAGFAKGLLSQGANIKAWGDMMRGAFERVAQAARMLWGAIQEAFKFETLTVQFKTLLGSLEAAQKRMAMLAKFAAETPFQLEGLTKASRTLTVMSKDALGTEWALRLVGDTAAATGGSIEELAMWVGRAYAMIQAGKPFGEAAMRLTELGALTPQVRQKMEDLQAAGASNSEVWETLVKHLETFEGAMLGLSRTGDGLTSTLKDNWTAAVRTFGEEFMVTAKESIQFLIDKLAKLQSDGTIQRWAKSALDALKPLRDLMMAIFGDEETRGEGLRAAWDYLRNVFDYGAALLRNAFDYAGQVLRAAALDAVAAMKGRIFGDHTIGDQMREVAAEAYRVANIHAGEMLKQQSKDFAAAVDAAATKARERAKADAATAAEESAEVRQQRLEAEKQKASDALYVPLPPPTQKEEAEKKAEAEAAAAAAEASKDDERIAIQQWRDERLKGLKPYFDRQLAENREAAEEAKRRATDSDYAREAEREERRQNRSEKAYKRRQERLLERIKDMGLKGDIFDENFDVSRLSKRERRLRDAMIAERNVKTLEDLEKKAYEDAAETARNTASIAHDIKNILTFR